MQQSRLQHQLHMLRPTFHCVLTHFRKSPGMNVPFYSTNVPQYLRCGQTDSEIDKYDIFYLPFYHKICFFQSIIRKRTSFPNGKPLPKIAIRPTNLATSVLNVRYSFKVTPRKMVFISGIPEPIACGETR